MRRRTTMQVFNAALRGEITSDQAARELAPYREAALVVRGTRWAIVRRPRLWHDVVGLAIAVCCRALGADRLTVACVALSVGQWAALRLVRVPVKIPADPSFEAWRDHVDALREHRRRSGDSICGCERCGHGRLACDPCDECGRTGLVP
mgnify:FL=1